jgi:hypothetical protein
MSNNAVRRLEKTCAVLGPKLLERLTLVGGTRQALLPLTVSTRATLDVDFIVEAHTIIEWQRFMDELQEASGFRPSTEEDAPICRYEKRTDDDDVLVIDVMPTSDALGFHNPWYPSAHRNRVYLPSSSGIYAASPLDHLLTKIEAYKSRGASDPLSSHDLEDIVAIIISLDDVMTAIESGTTDECIAARAFLIEFARRDDAKDLLLAHTDSAAQRLVPALHSRLTTLAGNLKPGA